MSIKTLALLAAVVAGSVAFENRASAQVYYSSGYYSPGVVTSSYYAPAGGYVYASPLVGGYTSYYGGYPYASYYGYPAYGGAYAGYYPGWRRGWWGRRGWWY